MSATGAARSSIARLQSEVAGLTGQLSTLQSSWTGQASNAFTGVMGEWTATQRHVEETLGAITVALGHAGQQYAEIEAANTRLFAR